MKKLLLTCTDLMLLQFMLPHIEYLSYNGYCIDLACSEVGERFSELKEKSRPYVNKIYRISSQRSPLNINNYKAYKQLKLIIEKNHYNIIWTNEPVIGVITRLAAKRVHTESRVIYMVHGFHFYKGSSIKNWILFYPIEYIMSFLTDTIITINNEDYVLATKNFHSRNVKYIHGIGLDTRRFNSILVDKEAKRKEFSIPDDGVLLLSTGELSERKNHEVIIRALIKLKNYNIYYIVCGEGKLRDKYENLIKSNGFDMNIFLPGYRRDIGELCKAADIFVHPSKREGLGIAALEGMACGLPLIASNINGIKDYTINGVTGFNCTANNIDEFAEAISKLIRNKELREQMGKKAKIKSQEFDISIARSEVLSILETINGDVNNN